MKKKVLLTALTLAATVFGAQAVDVSELRIYINPGHGGWTPNDRPCTLVGHGAYSRTKTDTLSFFESNTDLEKGFGTLEALIKKGLVFDRTLNQTGDDNTTGAARDMENNIVMSRVKNGPFFDDNGTENQYKSDGKTLPENYYVFNRNLTEICEEVDDNNFDMFISIHSNAATEGGNTNYPLFLYRGFDAPADGQTVPKDIQDTSKAMAKACWAYAYGNTHAVWTAYSLTSMNLRGDIDFYHSSSTSSATGCTGYLGVLKHHSPGFLVEGYFHTYQPARHRAMNWDVCRLEGNAYARGIADYFGLDKETTGTIYGIVRDKYTKFKESAYTPNGTSADAYKPLNGIKVTLKKDGVEVATYTTDNYYNGAFVFNELAPGKYTIECENEQYLPMDAPLEVEVKANADVYPSISLVDKDWTPPTIVYSNYEDISVPGTYAADSYEFTQKYVDEAVPALEGKTVRRVIARGEKLYILALAADNTPTIVVYDAANKAVLAEVSTNGAQGTQKAISDIQVTADGVLVATNENLNHFNDAQVKDGEVRGENRIYRWENDENGVPTGDPIQFLSSMLSGNFYRAYVGSSMVYSGTLAEGKIVVPAYTAATTTSHKFFYNIYNVTDSVLVGEAINNKANDSMMTLEIVGDNYTLTTSPLDDDKFITLSSKISPAEYNFNSVATPSLMPSGLADGSNTGGFFRYNGHAFVVTGATVDGKNTGFALTDITEGLNNAKSVGLVNATLPEAGNSGIAASVTADRDDDGNVTAAYLNMFAVRDGKISYLTTRGVTVQAEQVPMAYDLKAVLADQTATVTFNLSGKAKAVALVMTPDQGDVIRKELGAMEAGEQTVNVDRTELEAGKSYNWAIEVASATVPVSGQVYNNASGLSVRGGVVPMTDPTQPSFGKVVVAYGKVEGFDVFDPMHKVVASRIFRHNTNISPAFTNQSDPFRGSEYKGYAVFPCWGDKAAGVVGINVNDLNEEPFGLFQGTNDGTGNYVLDGVNLGGGSAGACILGDGEDTRLYTFAEDVEGKNGKGTTENSLWCYNIGTAMRVSKAPTQLPNNGYKSTLANGQADLCPYGNGFFAVQCRGEGNNAASVPGFIYYSATDNAVTYNSSVLADETLANRMTSSQDAVAITPDGSMFAVAQTGKISIYDVTWNGTKPEMTFRCNIVRSNPRYTHLRFDYAGNLHAYFPSDGYRIFSIARENPVVTVPATAAYAISGMSAVESIVEDAETAPAIYYNMQGIRVDGDNLTPGIYIKNQSKTSTKIVVK